MQVCFVAFWDEITLSVQESAGHVIGEGGFIGKWRVVVVRDLPFSDQRLNGKIPKVISCRVKLIRFHLFLFPWKSFLFDMKNVLF